MTLNNGIYFKNKNISDEDWEDYIKTYVDTRYSKKLLNILFMYMVSKGETPKRAKVSCLYPYYSKILETDVPEKRRFYWLMRIARILERNMHKQFDLKDLINKG